jgi:hypothetical protein
LYLIRDRAGSAAGIALLSRNTQAPRRGHVAREVRSLLGARAGSARFWERQHGYCSIYGIGSYKSGGTSLVLCLYGEQSACNAGEGFGAGLVWLLRSGCCAPCTNSRGLDLTIRGLNLILSTSAGWWFRCAARCGALHALHAARCDALRLFRPPLVVVDRCWWLLTAAGGC